jgi:uncharacterized protein (UPF0332 family)
VTDENRAANARSELERAREALGAAEALLAAGFPSDAVSRAYYSAYHGACALLSARGDQPRTHRGILALFHRHFAETGLLDGQIASILPRLEERRSVADYRATERLDAPQAAALVADAQRFVAAIAALLPIVLTR